MSAKTKKQKKNKRIGIQSEQWMTSHYHAPKCSLPIVTGIRQSNGLTSWEPIVRKKEKKQHKESKQTKPRKGI